MTRGALTDETDHHHPVCRDQSLYSLCRPASPAPRAAEPNGLEYNRDIRPILAENCFACHGPDSAARKADLRLDRREAAVKAGAIVARRAGRRAS